MSFPSPTESYAPGTYGEALQKQQSQNPTLLGAVMGSPRIAALVLTAFLPKTTTLVFLVGIFATGYFVVNLLRFLLHLTVLPGKSLKKYGAGRGASAVITGATGALGREYALQLAKAGFNLVLIARSGDKLNQLKSDIEGAGSKQKSPPNVIVHPFDFVSASESDWDNLERVVRPLHVGVLVNAAGTSHPTPLPFASLPGSQIRSIITTNVLSALRTASFILPGMTARKNGLVLSLSRTGGEPFHAALAASRAALVGWSESVASEMKGGGVDVEVVSVGGVAGGLDKSLTKPHILLPTPSSFVRSSLNSIGVYTHAKYSVTPFWWYTLTEYVVRWVVPSDRVRSARYSRAKKRIVAPQHQATKGVGKK